MMFATCAHIGCYRKIAYNPEDAAPRPRYCSVHMDTMVAKLGTGAWIDITRIRNNPPEPAKPTKMVVLVCPICKTRKTSPANLHGYIEPCETEGCSGRMIYHKDVK